MHAFSGIVHANNGNDVFPVSTFVHGKAHKDAVSSTFPNFLTYQGEHDDLLNILRSDATNYFQDEGWTAFGTTLKSFYKCQQPGPNLDNCWVIHVVDEPGELQVSYLDVLDKSGVGYQANVYGNTFRWCETNWQGTACKQNGQHAIYSDNQEGPRTLVVFTHAASVQLETTQNGKKWGPSVFAPDTDVMLKSEFADGQLIVKNLVAANNRNADQLHGNCFGADILCF